MASDFQLGQRFSSFDEFHSIFGDYCEYNNIRFHIISAKFITNCSSVPSDLTTIGYSRSLKYSHVYYRCIEHDYLCLARINLKAVNKKNLGIVDLELKHNHISGPLTIKINETINGFINIFQNSEIEKRESIINDLQLILNHHQKRQDQISSIANAQAAEDVEILNLNGSEAGLGVNHFKHEMAPDLQFGQRFNSFDEFHSIFSDHCKCNNIQFNVINCQFITNCSIELSNLTTMGYLRSLKYSNINYRCIEHKHIGCSALINVAAIDDNHLKIVDLELEHNHPSGPLAIEMNDKISGFIDIFQNSDIEKQENIISNLQLILVQYGERQDRISLISNVEAVAGDEIVNLDGSEAAAMDPLSAIGTDECPNNDELQENIDRSRERHISELDASDVELLEAFSAHHIDSNSKVVHTENATVFKHVFFHIFKQKK